MKLRQGKMRMSVGLAVLALLLTSVNRQGAAGEPGSSLTTTPPLVTKVGDKSLTQWINDLHHTDPSVREEAIRAIVMFPNADEAATALIDRLHDPDASPRMKAVLALGMIKFDEKDRAKIVDALAARMMEEPQAPIRYDLAQTLGGMGKDARAALPALLHGVEDQSSFEIRRICISVLAQAGQGPDKVPDVRVTHALLAALNDRASQVRLQAVMTLAELGKPADEALLVQEIKSVKALETDRDKTVVIWAHLSMMALGKIDDADIDYLTKCARPGEAERIRVQAIGALGMVGTKEKKVVPTLIDLASEKDAPNIVASACRALGAVGDPGQRAEKALADVSHDKDIEETARCQAVNALAAIGAKSRTAVAILIELLKERNTNVVLTTIYELGAMEDPGSEVELALSNLAVSKEAEETVRKYAERILEAIRKRKK
jgi:HEAT repeat protein